MLRHKTIMKSKTTCLILLSVGLVLATVGVFFRSVHAQTWVEGHITTDTTWTVTDSPYVVINDVIVDANVTLTIEPGVEVRFGGDFSLIINGSLHAVGTDSSLITFNSNKLEPLAGDWNSINFIGEEDESFTMKYCVTRYAKNGITLEGLGKAVIERSEVSNNSESGVQLAGGTTVILKENTISYNKQAVSASRVPSRTMIVNNSFVYNSAGGLTYYILESGVSISAVAVSENNISFNGAGIILYGKYGNISKVTITENAIHDNGVGIDLVCGTNMFNVTVSGNIVHSNNGHGICMGSDDMKDMFDVIVSGNMVYHNNRKGIRLNGGSTGNIFNVTISQNTVYSNVRYGIDVSGAYKVFNVTLSDNTVDSNSIGIYLGSGKYMFDVAVSRNTVYSNAHGIYMYNEVYTYNVTFSRNIVHSNEGDGIYLFTDYRQSNHYTFLFFNKVSANENGIHVKRIYTRSLNNSISYNSQGIYYDVTQNNLAHGNDIYRNSYGMFVSTGAIVDAEYNYWGDASGPYHVSLNPTGKGNSVNGDGTDLDFIPFLTSPVGAINQRPVAILEVDRTDPNVDESVTFDATGSTDDGRIDYYFFDFGDGKNSGWTQLSVVTHKYASEGNYNASLIVMDDFGVTSLEGDLVYTEITVVPEFPAAFVLPILMILSLAIAMLKKKIPAPRMHAD